jgi:hypothetical protein
VRGTGGLCNLGYCGGLGRKGRKVREECNHGVWREYLFWERARLVEFTLWDSGVLSYFSFS